MTTVKTGYLLRYGKGSILDKEDKWKKNYFVLYSDSTLTWYKNPGDTKDKGTVLLKNIAYYIAVGDKTSLPDRPMLPPEASVYNLISIPQALKKKKIHWILCEHINDLNAWMEAIASTLPPDQQLGAGPSAPQFGAGPSVGFDGAAAIPGPPIGIGFEGVAAAASYDAPTGAPYPPPPGHMPYPQ
ncbi:unnamed protein product [Owenia fusiformis]|uniref:Uncharacterized protein n=1 Tax=Owenia fusiformis TaxID=6347 RepID=A0A8J1UAA5_OWEFU|nr:unnamed protein product [Owenia fusiformis]